MTASGWLAGGRGDRLLLQAVLVQLIPDELGARGSNALADRERMAQVYGGFGRPLGQQAGTDSGQGAGFLRERANLTGDGERLIVEVSGFLRRRGLRR